MTEKICKTDHAKIESLHCPECGKELRDPDEVKIREVVRAEMGSVLESFGFERPASETKKKEPPKRSIGELFKGKKKESE